MVKRHDVFGIGTALVDYFAKCTDEFLSKNELIKGATNFLPREKLDELHSRVLDLIFMCLPGDNARNVCEGVSFLGGKSAYASCIAEDAEGKIFEESLRAQRIDSFLEKRPGRTGKIIVFITRDRQRTFAADLGNSRDYDALPAEGIKNSNFLHLTSITLLDKGPIARNARDAMDLAEGSGVRISISLESPPMISNNKTKLRKIISRADVLFANEEELEALTGSKHDDAARALAEDIDTVCLKKGKSGSVIFSRGKRFPIPCYSVKVVDTTGAGDFYAAGVLFGLSRGQSTEAAGNLGAKLAAKTVATFGATLPK
ncbi:MAG: adenosine kinase [Candidatus Hodarchaeaceae archaeon]|nr:adenosine kinase [Candidatus Hodarchaeaceae archaeon]